MFQPILKIERILSLDLEEVKYEADSVGYTAIASYNHQGMFFILANVEGIFTALSKGMKNFNLDVIKRDGQWHKVLPNTTYASKADAMKNASLEQDPIIVKYGDAYHVFYGAEPFGYSVANGDFIPWPASSYVVLCRYMDNQWVYV